MQSIYNFVLNIFMSMEKGKYFYNLLKFGVAISSMILLTTYIQTNDFSYIVILAVTLVIFVFVAVPLNFLLMGKKGKRKKVFKKN